MSQSTIPFTCPHCGIFTDVDARYAGEKGPCGTCGATIAVPAGAPRAARPAASSSGATTRMTFYIMLGGLASASVLAMVFFLVLKPALKAARSAASRSTCASNLRRIGVAMKAYHADYGAFPPAYVADSSGKPMHSWRVLLLPYLDAKWLYDKYDFSQPWDSPNNITLSGKIPLVYQCPDDQSAMGAGESNYLVIVGAGTMFPGEYCTTENQIASGDGLPSTIMVVEGPTGGRSWLEPVDLQFNQMGFDINVGEISSYHTMGGAHALTADGTVHFLYNTTSPERVKAMATINGGEDATEIITW